VADVPHFILGAALPDLVGTWKDDDGDLIDLTDYTLDELRIGDKGSAALLVKTSGVTLADTDPNVTISWDVGELDALPVKKVYSCALFLTRTADDKPRVMPFTIYLEDTVATAAP